MKVFLSWSGRSSKSVAGALRDWMPHIINDLEPWVSSEDIYAGDRWVVELGRMLEETAACVLCVTPENLKAPWLYFEAGAASKKLDKALVCPYLVGVTPRSLLGPLHQFQACEGNEEGTLRLILALHRQLRSPALSEVQVKRSFKKFWPDLEIMIKSIDLKAQALVPEREMLEDLNRKVATLSANVDLIAGMVSRLLPAFPIGQTRGAVRSPRTRAQNRSAAKGKNVKQDLNRLLKEIDDINEENSKEFTKSYVQRGGE